MRTEPLKGEPGLIWALAVMVAGLGAWVMFDARPGLNWLVWTATAVTGLGILRRRQGAVPNTLLGLAAVPVVIAGAAVVTANEVILVLVCLSIVFLLAVLMLLTGSGTLQPLGLRAAVIAPLVAIRHAVIQTVRRSIEATNLIQSNRAREWVRGLAITIPVLIGFSLLLAAADPVFAGWRDAVGNLVQNWDFVPRSIFFAALLVVVLGAYGYASIEPEAAFVVQPAPQRWLGSTERLLLFGSIAGLFWLFLAVQVGYLFGNLPRMAASGVTFAEYARRGFGELSVVASISTILIIISEQFGQHDGKTRTLRFLTFAVIAAVLLLLGSAFRRVLLYEAAYGFTTARLYAQVYMCAVAAGLVVLSLEVAGEFQAGRLFRRAAAAALVLFIGLAYWNHEGWIAGRNIDRFAETGQLDVAFLAKELSPDAMPAIGERLAGLPEPVRAELRLAVRERALARKVDEPGHWFEWNLRRARARRALAQNFN